VSGAHASYHLLQFVGWPVAIGVLGSVVKIWPEELVWLGDEPVTAPELLTEVVRVREEDEPVLVTVVDKDEDLDEAEAEAEDETVFFKEPVPYPTGDPETVLLEAPFLTTVPDEDA